jgi:uracil-DNA glycosylase family 4
MSTEMDALEGRIVRCRLCPRLVAWREEVARTKRAAFADEDYWGRPLPGFGDPDAAVVVLGLAPAAHGGNRTGRIFTGDRSGDWLYRALHRARFANQPTSTDRGDGLELRDCWVAAAVRCAPPANKPLPSEKAACEGWLERELALLPNVRVVLCLGQFAWTAALTTPAIYGGPPPRPRPRFAHGATHARTVSGTVLAPVLVGCFHPSQQNTFTGKLTAAMMDDVLARVQEMCQARFLRGDA